MKKILLLIVLVLLFACNSAQEPDKVDLAAEEAAISEAMETLFKSIDDRDPDLFASVFADDGVFICTDPTEIYSKDSIVESWAQMMQSGAEIPPFDFISEPFIRIQPDGKTAVVVHQYYWKLFTSIPLRQTFWMVKKDAAWLIDFFDFSFIPYNEQVPALNAAVMKDKE